jgi:CubicO group peptidase (beta-lactamase class C family)
MPGNYIYKKAAGYDGVAEDAKPLEFDQASYIASCTKLIASIGSLQVVERGLVGLDEPLDIHVHFPRTAEIYNASTLAYAHKRRDL